jgi:hypothetical protein
MEMLASGDSGRYRFEGLPFQIPWPAQNQHEHAEIFLSISTTLNYETQ